MASGRAMKNWNRLKQLRMNYLFMKELFSEENELLFLRHCKRKFLHEMHQGIVKTKQFLRSRFFWPGMDSAAEAIIKNCRARVLNQPLNTYKPLLPVSLPCGPWVKGAAEIVGSITKLKFVFLVTQVCQSTAWCFEWRPKNSAPIPSLKRPLAGNLTGSVVTPSPWERRSVLLSVYQPTWKTRSLSFIDSSWDLASAGATIWVVSSIWTKRQCSLSCRPPEPWNLFARIRHGQLKN